MRLNRLDLTRYGHFTGRSLSFPLPAPGAPDLHVIYGANEAGKSTLLTAWLDLLFGIHLQSRNAFLHPGPTMRIGNTQTAIRFREHPDDYLARWFSHGPTHHCAMSVGHNAALFDKVAQLMGIEHVRL